MVPTGVGYSPDGEGPDGSDRLRGCFERCGRAEGRSAALARSSFPETSLQLLVEPPSHHVKGAPTKSEAKRS